LITILATSVLGAMTIEFKPHEDERGQFFETFNQRTFEAYGLPFEFVQDNLSRSKKNVVRGLHMQRENPQGKMVICLSGAVQDVCVDLRPWSPSFKRVSSVVLDSRKNTAFYVPPGCAHGFAALTDDAMLYYKCTTAYDKQSDGGIFWNDPEISIPWMVESPIVSEKDSKLPMLKDYL
jgi:dTDP-4-dehydrorhamnose 3,5-epimerase